MESICRFGSCCDLHQNRFPGHSLYDIDNIVFVVSAGAAAAIAAVVAVYYSYIQDNHVVHLSLHLMGFSHLFFDLHADCRILLVHDIACNYKKTSNYFSPPWPAKCSRKKLCPGWTGYFLLLSELKIVFLRFSS
jgi:hypothetical protein